MIYYESGVLCTASDVSQTGGICMRGTNEDNASTSIKDDGGGANQSSFPNNSTYGVSELSLVFRRLHHRKERKSFFTASFVRHCECSRHNSDCAHLRSLKLGADGDVSSGEYDALRNPPRGTRTPSAG